MQTLPKLNESRAQMPSALKKHVILERQAFKCIEDLLGSSELMKTRKKQTNKEKNNQTNQKPAGCFSGARFGFANWVFYVGCFLRLEQVWMHLSF